MLKSPNTTHHHTTTRQHMAPSYKQKNKKTWRAPTRKNPPQPSPHHHTQRGSMTTNNMTHYRVLKQHSKHPQQGTPPPQPHGQHPHTAATRTTLATNHTNTKSPAHNTKIRILVELVITHSPHYTTRQHSNSLEHSKFSCLYHSHCSSPAVATAPHS